MDGPKEEFLGSLGESLGSVWVRSKAIMLAPVEIGAGIWAMGWMERLRLA